MMSYKEFVDAKSQLCTLHREIGQLMALRFGLKIDSKKYQELDAKLKKAEDEAVDLSSKLNVAFFLMNEKLDEPGRLGD